MKRSTPLDGIRGLAIIMVVAGHVALNYSPLDPQLRRWLMAFANASGGVRLFFVLSGYLITTLLLQEFEATQTLGLRRFYVRRALRILPAFYAFLVVLRLIAVWRPMGISSGHWWSAATFTWNYAFFWVPTAQVWDLGHFWTLALEQQFYVVWPLVLLGLGPRRAFWVVVALIVWCPLARVGSYWLFPGQRGYLGMMFHTGADSIMVGCATALVFGSPDGQKRLAAWGRLWVPVAACWLLLASPVAAECIRGFPVVAGFTVDAFAAGLLIAWVHRRPAPIAEAVLGRGPLPALGVISYSLYLWQQLFLSPTGPLADGHWLEPVAGAVGAATLSYWVVERPMLRLKKHTQKHSPVPVAA